MFATEQRLVPSEHSRAPARLHRREESPVGKQIVMDATGDTERKFNPADAVAVADAEKRVHGAGKGWL